MNKIDLLANTIKTETLDWFARSRSLFGNYCTFKNVRIKLDLKGRAAGQLRYKDDHWELRFNLAMAALQPDAFIAQTIPHEVAHLVIACTYPKSVKPHGREWRSVMKQLGADPDVTHQFKLADNTRLQRRWTYQCACRTHQISTTRHKRILQGKVYFCRECSEPLHTKREEIA